MLRPKIELKTKAQIDEMRPANKLVAECLLQVEEMVRPGVTTLELDQVVERMFDDRGARPLFKGYPGKVPFPAVCCISVNDEVVHGIPGPRVLKEGDIVTVDTGCNLDGWCGDAAITVPVGRITPAVQRLIDVAWETLDLAIELLHQRGKYRKWSQIAARMEENVHDAGFGVVEQFVGHGIGRAMHEEPQVPNFRARNWAKHDFWLDPGLVIAVEPMVNMGTKEVKVLDDQWTVATADGKPSSHVEHTLALTATGCEILTARSELA